MNYIQSIVKILESPKRKNNNVIIFRAQLPKTKYELIDNFRANCG